MNIKSWDWSLDIGDFDYGTVTKCDPAMISELTATFAAFKNLSCAARASGRATPALRRTQRKAMQAQDARKAYPEAFQDAACLKMVLDWSECA